MSAEPAASDAAADAAAGAGAAVTASSCLEPAVSGGEGGASSAAAAAVANVADSAISSGTEVKNLEGSGGEQQPPPSSPAVQTEAAAAAAGPLEGGGGAVAAEGDGSGGEATTAGGGSVGAGAVADGGDPAGDGSAAADAAHPSFADGDAQSTAGKAADDAGDEKLIDPAAVYKPYGGAAASSVTGEEASAGGASASAAEDVKQKASSSTGTGLLPLSAAPDPSPVAADGGNLAMATKNDSESASGGGSYPHGGGGNTLIRLRGAPWDVTPADVLSFISAISGQLTEADVLVERSGYDGRATGEVLVRLPSLAARDRCLAELHGQNMGRRWIGVFKANEIDASNFQAIKDAERSEKRGALRLRGLPYSTNEFEIAKFFTDAGFEVDINSVVLGHSRENRLSGDAWVLLESPDVAENARRALHKKMIGRRYIELFVASPREVELARRGQTGPTGPGGGGGGGYGMAAGRPAPGMLGQYNGAPAGGGGGYDSGGGGGGGYGASASAAPFAGRAGRYDPAQRVSPYGGAAAGAYYGGGGGRGGGGGGQSPSYYGAGAAAAPQYGGGGGYGRDFNSSRYGRSPMGAGPGPGAGAGGLGAGGPGAGAGPGAGMPGYHMGGAGPGAGSAYGGGGVPQEYGSDPGTPAAAGGGGGGGYYGGGGGGRVAAGSYAPYGRSDSDGGRGPAAAAAESFAAPPHHGHHHGFNTPVLRLRGLPYYANEHHIVQFFTGFHMAAILPATAHVNGRPSGEAYVEFASPDEAWRALKTRNQAMMDRRYIELFPASREEMEMAAQGVDPREIRSRFARGPPM